MAARLVSSIHHENNTFDHIRSQCVHNAANLRREFGLVSIVYIPDLWRPVNTYSGLFFGITLDKELTPDFPALETSAQLVFTKQIARNSKD